MGLLIPNNLSMTTFGVIKCPPACYAFEIRVVLPAVGCRESGPCELVTCNNPICNRLQPLSPGKNPSHHRQSNWDGTNGGFAKTKRRSPRLGHWRRLASRSFAVLGPNVCHQHPRSLQSTPICLVHPCRDRGDHPCPQHGDTTQHRHHSPIHRWGRRIRHHIQNQHVAGTFQHPSSQPVPTCACGMPRSRNTFGTMNRACTIPSHKRRVVSKATPSCQPYSPWDNNRPYKLSKPNSSQANICMPSSLTSMSPYGPTGSAPCTTC